jgi:hypothetical protein
MKLIESKILVSDAASIEFTSIPQDRSDLLLLASLRTVRSNQKDDALSLWFNGSNTNRTIRVLYGDQGVGNASFTNLLDAAANGGSSTANTFANIAIYIPKYNSGIPKVYSSESVSENNAAPAFTMIGAGLWNSTAAITSLKLQSSENFSLTAGSSISLYSITAGSDGITAVS